MLWNKSFGRIGDSWCKANRDFKRDSFSDLKLEMAD